MTAFQWSLLYIFLFFTVPSVVGVWLLWRRGRSWRELRREQKRKIKP